MSKIQEELNEEFLDYLDISFQVELDKVKEFLEAGASSKAVDVYGFTPLHKAVQTKNTKLGIKIIELLIDKYGANIDAITNTGVTPLHLALMDNPGIAKFLLFQRKVSTEVFSKGVSSPLIYAIKCGNRESAEIMIQNTVLQNPDYPKPDDVTNNPKLSKHWKKCRREVRRMQEQDQSLLELLREPSKKIADSCVSLNQFLTTENANVLAGYLFNEETGLQSQLNNLISNYPEYASIIKSQYNRGMERRDLLSKGSQVLQHCAAENNIYSLKDLCNAKINGTTLISRMPVPEDQSREAIEAIASRLTDVDMENFIRSTGPKAV